MTSSLLVTLKLIKLVSISSLKGGPRLWLKRKNIDEEALAAVLSSFCLSVSF